LFVCLLIRSLHHSLIHPFIDSSVLSFIHSFTHSLVYSSKLLADSQVCSALSGALSCFSMPLHMLNLPFNAMHSQMRRHVLRD